MFISLLFLPPVKSLAISSYTAGSHLLLISSCKYVHLFSLSLGHFPVLHFSYSVSLVSYVLTHLLCFKSTDHTTPFS